MRQKFINPISLHFSRPLPTSWQKKNLGGTHYIPINLLFVPRNRASAGLANLSLVNSKQAQRVFLVRSPEKDQVGTYQF